MTINLRELFRLFILTTFAGCGVFEPRDAETPKDLFARTFASYQEVLDEIRDIYVTGQSENLRLLFDENDTQFTFQGVVEDTVFGVPLFWHRDEEIKVTQAMLKNGGVKMSPVDQNILDKKTDSVLVEWKYSLTTADGGCVEGTAHLKLVRRINRFYWTRWEDQRDGIPTAPCKSWGKWRMENFFQ